MDDPAPLSTAPREDPLAHEGAGGTTLRGLIAGIPDLALAGAFLLTWLRPWTFGETAVQYFLLTMLLEFIIVHSSAFMGTVALSRERTSRRVLAVLGLGGFYSLFVVGFALGFGTWWPMWAFWGLTLNRLLGLLLGNAPHGMERMYVKAGWALAALFYVVGAMVTVMLPVPELGVTAQVRGELALPGGGLWIDEPHRVLAFGFLYFGLTGWAEIRGWARSEAFLKGVPAD